VAIDVDAPIDRATAVLAVLFAGGACLPLDPAYPAERRSYMIADAQPALVLGAEHVARASGPLGAVASPGPDALAYVLYTSGSTGRPKGVALPHRALANLIDWQLADTPAARTTLQLAPASFDVSFQELFVTWCSGGLLVLADAETRRDVELLGARIAEARVERLFVPAVLLRELAERFAGEPARLASLVEVFASGEQLTVTPALARLFERLPACRLYNHYGPTETHVVTAYALPAEPRAWPAHVPIGRPIANVRALVLDRARELTPLGATGELAEPAR